MVVAMRAVVVIVLLYPAAAVGWTGNEWRGMAPAIQSGYIAGVFDAWRMHIYLVRNPPHALSSMETVIAEVVDCVLTRKMTYTQIIAITRKYMDSSPERWDQDMVESVYGALTGACKPQ
jgi:hypothetical protein